jgi:hypothetical protein
MKNSDVAQAFANGSIEAFGSNMFIDGNAIYSYGRHFPMALRLTDYFVFNDDKYSVTTGKHKGYVFRAIENRGKVIFADTKSIKLLIDNGVHSLSDVNIKNIEVEEGSKVKKIIGVVFE